MATITPKVKPMPMFDMMVRLVQAWLPMWKHLLDACMCFHWPVIAHEVLPKLQPDVDLELTEFRLPYPVIAVEDRGGVTVLVDKTSGQKGLHTPRLYLDCIPPAVARDPRAYAQGSYGPQEEAAMLHNPVCQYPVVNVGSMVITGYRYSETSGEPCTWMIEGTIDHSLVGTPDRLIMPPDFVQRFDQSLQDATVLTAVRNAVTCMDSIMTIPTLPEFGVPPAGGDPGGSTSGGWPPPELHPPPPGLSLLSHQRPVWEIHPVTGRITRRPARPTPTGQIGPRSC